LDDKARVDAILLATQLGITCHLNLNCFPQNLYSSEASIRTTLEPANKIRTIFLLSASSSE